MLSRRETFSGVFRQAGIRLIMSPFRVHMIMVDCLQVFSDVLPMPGHGGRAQSLKLIHACGGLVLNRAAVKNHSLFDSGKYRCEATLDLHLLVSIYLTSWCSNWLRLSM